MLIPAPELASDLEWMLQSGQASMDMLIHALVKEYYTAVYRLCLAVLGNQQEAEAAAHETLASAPLNVHRYRAKIGAQNWIIHLALEECRRRVRKSSRRSLLQSLIGEIGSSVPPAATTGSQGALSFSQIVLQAGEREKLALAFYYVLELSAADTGRLLRVNEQAVHAQLDLFRHSFMKTPECAGAEGVELELRVQQLLAMLWPAPAGLDLEQIAGQIEALANKRVHKRRRRLPVQELAIVVLGLATAGAFIWGAIRYFPDTQGTPAPAPAAPAGESSFQLVEAFRPPAEPPLSNDASAPANGLAFPDNTTPSHEQTKQSVQPDGRSTPQPFDEIQTTFEPSSLPRALNKKSSQEEIRQRIALSTSYWRTAWLDARLSVYGPYNYAGPSAEYHIQVWAENPTRRLVLYGPLEGKPVAIHLLNGRQNQILRPKEGNSVGDAAQARAALDFLNTYQTRVLASSHGADWTTDQGSFQIIKETRTAARKAILLDWFDRRGQRQFRLTLDAVTGLLLRQEEFGGKDFQMLLSDLQVTKLVFNETFPLELFNITFPWNGEFSPDATLFEDHPDPLSTRTPEPGVSRPLQPIVSPPDGFVASQSALSFQAPVGSAQFIDALDMLAENYHIGTISARQPWALRCARSSDGQIISFTPWSDGASAPPKSLFWFNLAAPDKIYQAFQGFYTPRFAFSPDNRKLAVFAFGNSRYPDGIHILDIGTGAHKPLLPAVDAQNISWSPDGNYIAFYGALGLGTPLDWNVVNVGTGQVIYQQSLHPTDETPALDAWGIIPAAKAMGGLDACAELPIR